ncbi:hypothetical protein INR49_018981 [Caranx melampygus]|nr:hypothetical protein INR49_018981 [Caranx melampygus]
MGEVKGPAPPKVLAITRLHTGLCKIWVTLFFCSIILKSCLKSGDMFLLRRYSGSFSSTRSKYRSLELLLDRDRVRDPAVCLTSTRLMSSLRGPLRSSSRTCEGAQNVTTDFTFGLSRQRYPDAADCPLRILDKCIQTIQLYTCASAAHVRLPPELDPWVAFDVITIENVEMRMRGYGPLSPLVQESASSSSSDASFASVDFGALVRALLLLHLPTVHSRTPLHQWIWLFTLTSILGGTKAEVRCIPSCQLPPVTTFPRELSTQDLAHFGEAPAEEYVGFNEGSSGGKPSAGGDERHSVAELTASEESSSKVRLRGNKTSCLQKDALNDQQKLSQSKVFSRAFPKNVTDNSSGDAQNNRFSGGNWARGDVTVLEDKDAGRWRRTPRSAETWSGFRAEGGDEASSSDQGEFQLTSSTFALSGDTAHNQAMVHWSGQNSSVSAHCAPHLRTGLTQCGNPVADAVSMDLHQLPSLLCGYDGQAVEVILMLTKYYDFNSGRVTESSLWRSTDYGTTYEKLNEKVGPKTILSYLYVSPNNKRKIMLLTDPEVESSLLISLDEGASYQKHSLAFDILSLLFHPEQEDWILAYSHDQKLYVSVEFGRRWQLVHDGVVPNRFYWSRLGLDKEQGVIHLEISVSDGRSQYITCKLQNCSDGNKGKPFPGFIIPNSLVVQDEYVFIQVPIGGQSVHYVSYKRNTFYPMKLPKYTLPKDLQIISTDDNQVVAAIQDWHQNDSYNLYMSESRGLLFTLMLENVVSSGGPEGNIMIDLYEVAGIKGVFLSNKVVENQVKTYITYNKGRDWHLLQAPTTDLQGNKVYCEQPFCSLHLHLHVSENPYTSGNIVSKDSAPGIIIASGVVGPELTSTNALSNNCTEGTLLKYSPRRQKCPSQAPRGLQLFTSEGTLVATLGKNVTFLVFLEEGLGSTTSITVDFGDGTAISYVNVSSIEDGVKHIYSKVGIYQVSATASNTLGFDRVILYLHISCQLEQVQLSAPSVVVKSKAVNLTTVLRPSNVGTVIYYWWFDNKTEPVVTLDGAMSFTFSKEGRHSVTVQASVGSTVHQDQMTVAVYDHFRSHVLAFSSNLDELNPGVPEWREDICRVVKSSMVQVTGISEDQLLVTVLPGLPTTAEVFIVPEKRSRDGATDEKWAHLDQVLLSALNQDLIQFTLKPGVQVNVYATRLSPAPLVDRSDSGHSGTAVIMLVSVVLMGLAIFVIYKFKRKIPGINTYTAEQPDKEQEVIPTVTSIAVPNPEGDKLTSLDHVDVQLDTKSRGYLPSHTDIKLSDEAPHVF